MSPKPLDPEGLYQGDDALRRLPTAAVLDLAALPRLWRPATGRTLASPTAFFLSERWDRRAKSPAEVRLRALVNGPFNALGRLAMLKLWHGQASQNRLVDAWVRDHPALLALPQDPNPAVPQAAWVVAYLLADPRKRQSELTLARALEAATVHLPSLQRPPAAAALLGQGLELGTLLYASEPAISWDPRHRWFTVLTQFQAALLGACHPYPPAYAKALDAFGLAMGLGRTAASPILEERLLLSVPRAWRAAMVRGPGKPAVQDGISAQELEKLAAPPPHAAPPPPTPMLAPARRAWLRLFITFARFERDRGPVRTATDSVRILHLALLTLARHGQGLSPRVAAALAAAPASALDSPWCPPTAAAALRQAALGAVLNASRSPSPRAPLRL